MCTRDEATAAYLASIQGIKGCGAAGIMAAIALSAAGHRTPMRLLEMQNLDRGNREATFAFLRDGLLAESGPAPIPESDFAWLREQVALRYEPDPD